MFDWLGRFVCAGHCARRTLVQPEPLLGPRTGDVRALHRVMGQSRASLVPSRVLASAIACGMSARRHCAYWLIPERPPSCLSSRALPSAGGFWLLAV